MSNVISNTAVATVSSPLQLANKKYNSPLDAREKLVITAGSTPTLEDFQTILDPYIHMHVHVHEASVTTEGVVTETCIGVFEVDSLEEYTKVGKTFNRIKTYHQVYSETSGLYADYKPLTDHKDIIYYCTDTGNQYEGSIYLNGSSYGGSSYTPDADDDTVVDYQKPTAADLKNKSIPEVLDMILFPEYDENRGTLPVIGINNSDELIEVGTTINNASFKVTTAQSPCKYVLSESKYVAFNYTYSTGTLTTTIQDNETKAKFKVLTRTTAATNYKVIGPGASLLSEGSKLFKSKGTPSSQEPKQIGEGDDIALGTTSANITGFHYGATGNVTVKDKLIRVKPDGTVSYNNGTFSSKVGYNVYYDADGADDHNLGTMGKVYVILPVVSGVTYNVYLSGISREPTGVWSEFTNVTAALNALSTTQESIKLKDANNVEYDAIKYCIDPTSITIFGKFRITLNISK